MTTYRAAGTVNDTITSDGGVKTLALPDNIAGYGYTKEPASGAVLIENGITFGLNEAGEGDDKGLVQAGEAGHEITLPDGTRRLRICTSIAAADNPMIHIGGAVGVGWQFPLSGSTAIDVIEFDLSTSNVEVSAGNVIYLTYDSCDADEYVWLQAFGRAS